MIINWDWTYQQEDLDIKTIGSGEIWRWRVQNIVTGQVISDAPFGVCEIQGETNHRLFVTGFNRANNSITQFTNENLILRPRDGLSKLTAKILDPFGSPRRLPIIFETSNQQYTIFTNTVGEWYQFFVPKTKVFIVIDDEKYWIEIPTNDFTFDEILTYGYKVPK
jgi:hypothetical protein